MEHYIHFYPSPLGILRIETNDQYVISIQYTDLNFPDIPAQSKTPNNKPIQSVLLWLDEYFTGSSPEIANIPISFSGTTFQIKVWTHLLAIPYGQTVTYGQIAKAIAQECGQIKMSAQAVGQAVGANPICILIPCHRVVGKNGKLTGYAGGLDRKIWLLNHENAI